MFPVVCFMIADNPEMKLASGILDAQNTNMPCHVCYIPVTNSDNPLANYPFRMAEESKAAVDGWVKAPYGNKTVMFAKMKGLSLNGTPSVFNDANMGVPEGIHGALPVDRTHHLFLGLVKTCSVRLFDVISEHWCREHTQGRANKEARKEVIIEIDFRFSSIPRYIMGDGARYRHFPSGISDLTLLEAKDWASIVQFWPYVFGVGNR